MDRSSAQGAHHQVSPKKLWMGGYGPKDSAHGEGLSAFRRVVQTETDGEIAAKAAGAVL